MRSKLILFLTLAPALAHADVAAPPPLICPLGTEPASDHSSGYCRPSEPDCCPEGYLGRVSRDEAYCEPPPSYPCPAGSDWASAGEAQTFCRVLPECDGDTGSCVPTSFCLEVERGGNYCSAHRVVGFCQDRSDCGVGALCHRAFRYESDDPRVDPAYVPGDDDPYELEDLVEPGLTFPAVELEPCGANDCWEDDAYQTCATGFTCLPLALCAETSAGAEPVPGVTPVSGFCAANGSCAAPGVCDSRFRCVQDALVPVGYTPLDLDQALPEPLELVHISSCGCACSASAVANRGYWLAGALLLGLLLRRLRSRA